MNAMNLQLTLRTKLSRNTVSCRNAQETAHILWNASIHSLAHNRYSEPDMSGLKMSVCCLSKYKKSSFK